MIIQGFYFTNKMRFNMKYEKYDYEMEEKKVFCTTNENTRECRQREKRITPKWWDIVESAAQPIWLFTSSSGLHVPQQQGLNSWILFWLSKPEKLASQVCHNF
jgi:hypothetical protein